MRGKALRDDLGEALLGEPLREALGADQRLDGAGLTGVGPQRGELERQRRCVEAVAQHELLVGGLPGQARGERVRALVHVTEAAVEARGRRRVQQADPLAPVAGAYFAELPVAQIRPNDVQPRQVFDEDAMEELVHSVREIGVLQPVVVRRRGPQEYELVMGERRWRATQAAGRDVIPAIVRETDDVDMLRDALLENLHRSQLNPLEEAAAYRQMLDDFECTHEELADRIGRSRPRISNTLRLLKLSPAVQRRVAAGVLSAGHARALLAVADPDVQDRLAARVVAEGISVRGLEEIVAVRDGDDGGTPARVVRKKPVAPGLVDLAERLSDRFETRVKVDLGRAKGKITVEFASIDDLQRIVDIMDPRRDS